MPDFISLESLKEIPFFDHSVVGGRSLLSLTFFVKGDWHSWFASETEVFKVKAWPVESSFFGDKPELETDQYFPLLDLLAQHSFSEDLSRCFTAITNDYHGLAASLAKFRLLHDNRENKEFGIVRMVQSEIEHLTVVCRSCFDILQELVCAHVARIRVENKRQPNKLPQSFREVVFKSGKLQTPQEITDRFALPLPISQWYTRHADFFLTVRSIRDSIVHRGDSVKMLFNTERGFAVSRSQDPFRGLHTWSLNCEQPNSIVPIRPAVATIVKKTIEATDDFAQTIKTTFQLPPPVAPDFQFYLRGTNDRQFNSLEDVIKRSKWDDE